MMLLIACVLLVATTVLARRVRARWEEKRYNTSAFSPNSNTLLVDLDGVETALQRRRIALGAFEAQWVSLPGVCLDLRVTEAGNSDRLMDFLGIGRRLSCGDPKLDRAYIFSSDDARVADWLRQPQTLAILRRVLKPPNRRLDARNGRVEVRQFGLAGSCHDGEALALAQALVDLRSEVGSRFREVPPEVAQRAARHEWVLAVSTGLAITTIALKFVNAFVFFPAVLNHEWLSRWAYVAAIPVGLLLVFVTGRLVLAEAARARRAMLEAGSIGLLSFLSLCALLSPYANASLAVGPVVVERVLSREAGPYLKRIGGTARGAFRVRIHQVFLPALHSGAIPSMPHQISQRDVPLFPCGTEVEVESQMGAFGLPFVRRLPKVVAIATPERCEAAKEAFYSTSHPKNL